MISNRGQMDKQYTSLDVSKLAGVGRATVSRVLNNPHIVSKKTRDKVKKAISTLNYRPSATARSLVSGQQKVIGFVTDLHQHSFHRTGLIPGLGEHLTEKGYCLTVSTIDMWSKINELEQLPIFKERRCDGVIFNTEHIIGDIHGFCKRLQIPSIFINLPESYPHNCVMPNDESTSVNAVNHLLEKGHRRIAYLNGTISGHKSSIEKRQKGYEVAMLRAGLRPMSLFDELMPGDHPETVKEIERRIDLWLSEPDPPTAILTYGPTIVLKLMKVVYRRKIHIPEQFSVMSCDDTDIFDDLSLAITAVSISREEMGIRAIEMLMQKINGNGNELPTIIVPGRLMERDSVQQIDNGSVKN